MFKQTISAATAALKEMKEVTVDGDWQWYPSASKWALKCLLRIISPNADLVPNATNWYIMLDDTYPNGDVDFHPAKDNSLTVTFQHQFYNKGGEETVPWRRGRICAKTELFYLRKRGYDVEPFESHTRLKWHVERVLHWLEDAARGTLVDEGDLFELPDYDTGEKPYVVAFCESSRTYQIWRKLLGRYGTVRLALLEKPSNTYIAISFEDQQGNVHHGQDWNGYVRSRILREEIGAWVLLPEVLAFPPWQAPMTWQELSTCVDTQGSPWTKLVGRISGPLRDGQQHFVLIGFPIPQRIGDEPRQIHWQPLYLPVLSWAKGSKGYQSKKTGFLRRDRDVVFKSNRLLDWQRSENWHPNEIVNRGMFEPTVADEKILVIGAGAIGSLVCEMLVRAGAKNVTIVDDDKAEIGNLTRHTLSLKDVAMLKATALAAHLSMLSPHVQVEAIATKFEKIENSSADIIRKYGIVIDTTGNDDVLFHLESFEWSGSPFFCSVSVGLKAKRLYVLTARRPKFPRAFFMRHIKIWLEKDTHEYDGSPLPRSGGIGCWHPAFPARVDDMWLLASVAVKWMEGQIRTNKKRATLAVFEKVAYNGSFGGIKLVSEHHDNG